MAKKNVNVNATVDGEEVDAEVDQESTETEEPKKKKGSWKKKVMVGGGIALGVLGVIGIVVKAIFGHGSDDSGSDDSYSDDNADYEDTYLDSLDESTDDVVSEEMN